MSDDTSIEETDENVIVIDMRAIMDVEVQIRRMREVLNGENPDSFALWQHAWEDAMAACGYRRARLNPQLTHFHDDDNDGEIVRTVDYIWEADVDEYLTAYTTEGHYHPSENSWDTAHQCFVWVDEFRPSFVKPSLKLAEFLDMNNAREDN